MNTQRNAVQRHEKEIANASVPLCSDQIPPLEKDVNDIQAPVNPPTLTDQNIRVALLQMAKSLLSKHKPPLLKPKP